MSKNTSRYPEWIAGALALAAYVAGRLVGDDAGIGFSLVNLGYAGICVSGVLTARRLRLEGKSPEPVLLLVAALFGVRLLQVIDEPRGVAAIMFGVAVMAAEAWILYRLIRVWKVFKPNAVN